MRGQPQMPTSGSEDKGIEHKVRFLARLSLGSPTEDAETRARVQGVYLASGTESTSREEQEG